MNQDSREANRPNESLPDLPLTGEQDEDAKAGLGTHSGGGGAGKVNVHDRM